MMNKNNAFSLINTNILRRVIKYINTQRYSYEILYPLLVLGEINDVEASISRSGYIDDLVANFDVDQYNLKKQFQPTRISIDSEAKKTLEKAKKCNWSAHIPCYIESAPYIKTKIKLPVAYLLLNKLLVIDDLQLIEPQNESNPIKLEDLFLSELDNFSEFPQSLKLSLSEFIEKFYGRFYKQYYDAPSHYPNRFMNLLKDISKSLPIITNPNTNTENHYIIKGYNHTIYYLTENIARFIYVYLAYTIWKYDSINRKDKKIKSIKYINNISYQDYTGAYSSVGNPNRIFFDSDISYTQDNASILQNEDNTSLGSFFGTVIANGNYCDEFNTLLHINGSISLDEAIFISYIWHSRMWSEFRNIVKENPVNFNNVSSYTINEILLRTYVLNQNIYNREKLNGMNDFMRCVAYFFIYQANKHTKLTIAIRNIMTHTLPSALPSANTHKVAMEFLLNNKGKIINYLNKLDRENNNLYPQNQVYQHLIKCNTQVSSDKLFKQQLTDILTAYIASSNTIDTEKIKWNSIFKSLSPYLLDYDAPISESKIPIKLDILWFFTFLKAIYIVVSTAQIENFEKTNVFKEKTFDQSGNTNLSKQTFYKLSSPVNNILRTNMQSLLYLNSDFLSSTNEPLAYIDLSDTIKCVNIPLNYKGHDNFDTHNWEYLRLLIRFYALQYYSSWYILRRNPLQEINKREHLTNLKLQLISIPEDFSQIENYLEMPRTNN